MLIRAGYQTSVLFSGSNMSVVSSTVVWQHISDQYHNLTYCLIRLFLNSIITFELLDYFNFGNVLAKLFLLHEDFSRGNVQVKLRYYSRSAVKSKSFQ